MKNILLENAQNGGSPKIQEQKAFELANEFCKKNSVDNVVVYIPQMKRLKDFLKHINSYLPNVKNAFVCSPFNIDKHPLQQASNVVFIALYVSQDALIKTYQFRNCKARIVIPWRSNELQSWVDNCANEKIDINHAITPLNPKTISSPIVQNAIGDFPQSQGIVHPSDKKQVVFIFRTLRKYSIDYDVDEIIFHLLQHKKWSPKIVEKVRKMGIKIKGGGIVHGGKIKASDMKTAFKRWNTNNQ